MLNETVKRHITHLAKLHTIGEQSSYKKFQLYIYDAAAEGLVVPEDASEVYNIFMEGCGPFNVERDNISSNLYVANVAKLRYIINYSINYHKQQKEGE